MTPEEAVVREWHAALNVGDVERLVALSTEDVEVGGPRGSSRGRDVLRQWFSRAGIQLLPGSLVQRESTVVVEQNAAWRSSATGELTGQQTVATAFEVRDGRVAKAVRYPDLITAREAVGLDNSDSP